MDTHRDGRLEASPALKSCGKSKEGSFARHRRNSWRALTSGTCQFLLYRLPCSTCLSQLRSVKLALLVCKSRGKPVDSIEIPELGMGYGLGFFNYLYSIQFVRLCSGNFAQKFLVLTRSGELGDLDV